MVACLSLVKRLGFSEGSQVAFAKTAASAAIAQLPKMMESSLFSLYSSSQTVHDLLRRQFDCLPFFGPQV